MERIHSLIFQKQITLSIHFKYTHNRRLWVGTSIFFIKRFLKSYLLYLFLNMLNKNEIIEMLIISYIGLLKTENQS